MSTWHPSAGTLESPQARRHDEIFIGFSGDAEHYCVCEFEGTSTRTAVRGVLDGETKWRSNAVGLGFDSLTSSLALSCFSGGDSFALTEKGEPSICLRFGKRAVGRLAGEELAIWLDGQGHLALPRSGSGQALGGLTAISPDGAWLMLDSPGDTLDVDIRLRIRDSRTGQPVSGPLLRSNALEAVVAVEEGTRVVGITQEGAVMRWDAWEKARQSRVWIRELGEALTGMRMNGQRVEPMSNASRAALVSEAWNRVSSAAAYGDDAAQRILDYHGRGG